jgi:hypothetical protein
MSREPGRSDANLAHEDGVERLAAAIEVAAQDESEWEARLSAGLRAGLELLAADPPLARLLLVDSLAPSGPNRLQHERSLTRLAEALRPPAGAPGREDVSPESTRLLAGGLVSYLSGRVLAGEAEKLPDAHDFLLEYLLAPSR